MTIKTPESFARIKALTYLFVDASKRGYLEHLSTQVAIEQIGGIEDHPELDELRRKHEISGLQTVVFAGMAFESAIYDYAAVHLSDQYVRDHIDKLVSCPVSYRHMYCYQPGYHRNGRDRDGNGSSKSGTDLERS